MNSIRKLVKFLIDIFLLNLSLIISIFLKYDQIQITDRNINFFIYYNLSFCIIYFILKIYNNSWRFSGISEYTSLIVLSICLGVLVIFIKEFMEGYKKSKENL